MIIIGAMMLAFLSGCDQVKEAAMEALAELEPAAEEGWEYTTKIDKITQVHSASATKSFTDKDVDFVRADVTLTCENSDSLNAIITSYDTRPDKDGNLGAAQMSFKSQSSDNGEVTIYFVETRSGNNQIRYFADLPKYNNQLNLNVAIPNEKGGPIFGLLMAMVTGIDSPKESASLMVDNQWIIKVETKLGDPIITVDLNDPTVKKVTDQCNWHPAFSNSKPAVNTDSSTATEKTKKNSAENDYIQTKATFLGYAEMDWGCTSNFMINGEKVDVEGCPKDKMIYEHNKGKILTLKYKTGMVEGFKTYYFVDAQE